MKKWWAWSIDYHNRKGQYMTTVRGLLKADTEEEALDILWQLKGSDYACNACVGLLDTEADFVEFG